MYYNKLGKELTKGQRGYTVVHPNTKDETLPYKTYAEAKKYATHLSAMHNKAVEIKRYPNPYLQIQMIMSIR